MIQTKSSGIGEYITVDGAARLLGISYPTTYKRIRRSSIETLKLGTNVLVRIEDIEKLQTRSKRSA